MTDLETRIRELTLRPPADALDHRVLSALHSREETATSDSTAVGDSAAVGLDSCWTERNLKEPSRLRRGITSVMLSGFVVALLIGVAIGNSLPSWWSRPEQTTAEASFDQSLHSTVGVDSETLAADHELTQGHPMIPQLPADIRDELLRRGFRGSQFVESSYEAARAGVVLWERENGELFNVATHVSDRRFDMCRDCHRAGG